MENQNKHNKENDTDSPKHDIEEEHKGTDDDHRQGPK